MEAAIPQPRYDAEHISAVIFRYASLIGAEQDTDRLLELNADMSRDLVGRGSLQHLAAGRAPEGTLD